jgi:hypothetical protein
MGLDEPGGLRVEDANWLRARLRQNDELLWRARQVARELSEYRQEIRLQWDDAAAKQARRQFLTPHEESESVLLAQLGAQQEALTRSLNELDGLYATAKEADRHSLRVDHLLDETRAELARAVDRLERFADASSRARADVAEAEALVRHADSFGP